MRRTHPSLLFNVEEILPQKPLVQRFERNIKLQDKTREKVLLIQKGDCLWPTMICGNLFEIWSSGDF